MDGESHSLVGYSPWCLKESDMTEQLHFHFSLFLELKQQGLNKLKFEGGKSF